MKKNQDITKPRYSEQILPVLWALVISRFYCIMYVERAWPRRLRKPVRTPHPLSGMRSGNTTRSKTRSSSCWSIIIVNTRIRSVGHVRMYATEPIGPSGVSSFSFAVAWFLFTKCMPEVLWSYGHLMPKNNIFMESIYTFMVFWLRRRFINNWHFPWNVQKSMKYTSKL